MFTGIVQAKVKVKEISDREQFRRLTLEVPSQLLQNLERGASISVNGTCLTATEFSMPEPLGQVSFDVIDETLAKTNLGALSTGSLVNFERSLTFGREIGGHLVSGHVHGSALILAVTQTGANWRVDIELKPEFKNYVLSKGFISIDGISLTVGEVTATSFSLHLIPETLEVTTLGQRKAGDRVNIELDQQTVTIVDTVERVLAAKTA
ncbi:MAG: riboflavin synthase subunit alpha [Gammaproteobacteria bacterium]|nr:riboflavin synthase subunit alpha [Gammaproteobacteria bacterium]MBU2058716.1 riboflavin synthase subunit alpha [Gammaproteobacteria bacterium]MBU2177163.1 riboflavin synthase subunit alpha [Gammaproteobacteria bacterium]MBU2246420.1 riboflavin synthase subunit alpha [Gammaproteobacteria bacterium]MBU2342593.1 riboflavin synthase subunit alpha [Gammaproteobacteria bacterium]